MSKGQLWSKDVFAANLRRYMEQTGKTQRDIAKIAEVSPPTVNDWLHSKKYPRIDKIERLAKHFGILKSDLIEEKLTGEMHKKNDAIADIIVRLRTNEEFFCAVEELCKLDDNELIGVKTLLTAFKK